MECTITGKENGDNAIYLSQVMHTEKPNLNVLRRVRPR